MNKDQAKGNWHQFKGKIKEEWNKLTDDEIDAAEGRAEQLAGRIQEQYGIKKEEAEKRLKEMQKQYA